MAKENPSIPIGHKGPAPATMPTKNPITPSTEDKSPVTSKEVDMIPADPMKRDDHRRKGVDF